MSPTTMNCETALSLLPAYGDGELDLAQALELERHIESCPACAIAQRTQAALRQALRAAPYHRAPDLLRARLRAQLPLAPAAPAASAPVTPRRRDWSRWATAMAASLALAIGLNVFMGQRRDDDALTGELVSAQVRSLQAEHLSDVISTDQHTVKPWFNGRIDYAPPVRDFVAQGFPLEGGRLDYIGQHRVAALIYRRLKHPINLYIWPTTAADLAPAETSREGYSLVHWRKGGMEYWAVSDLNGVELREFAGLQIAAN
jgi:anti-sigma factor RsiW